MGTCRYRVPLTHLCSMVALAGLAEWIVELGGNALVTTGMHRRHGPAHCGLGKHHRSTIHPYNLSLSLCESHRQQQLMDSYDRLPYDDHRAPFVCHCFVFLDSYQCRRWCLWGFHVHHWLIGQHHPVEQFSPLGANGHPSDSPPVATSDPWS